MRATWNMEQPNTVFIIDTFSKYCNDKVVFTFIVNGKEYAVKEIQLEWGIPQLSNIEEDIERPYFKLYNTLDEAKEYIKELKRLEGVRF